MADVAEVGEELGFVEAGTEVADDVEGVAVAVDGFGEVAELVLGVAEAVPAACLAAAVAELAVQSEGSPAEGSCPVMVTGQDENQPTLLRAAACLA